jgi:Uma2 family endonuclease
MVAMSRRELNYSLAEYFAIEEMSEIRHEFFNGEIFAMAGGTPEHAKIINNLLLSFQPLMSNGCEPYMGNVRITAPSGLYTYPDLALVCGPPVMLPDTPPTITNPVVIAEVLSKSTRNYDRGRKFDLYSSILTFRDYLLVDQYRVDVEHRWRDGGEWRTARYVARENEIALTGVSLTLRVGALYERLSLPDTIPA